ncbi:hypothetical protein SNEBB_007041 [Seison nebaliae]|nr:hypothetical protein SNEBB_007041 [Seison nebaliae]
MTLEFEYDDHFYLEVLDVDDKNCFKQRNGTDKTIFVDIPQKCLKKDSDRPAGYASILVSVADVLVYENVLSYFDLVCELAETVDKPNSFKVKMFKENPHFVRLVTVAENVEDSLSMIFTPISSDKNSASSCLIENESYIFSLTLNSNQYNHFKIESMRYFMNKPPNAEAIIFENSCPKWSYQFGDWTIDQKFEYKTTFSPIDLPNLHIEIVVNVCKLATDPYCHIPNNCKSIRRDNDNSLTVEITDNATEDHKQLKLTKPQIICDSK